MSRKTTERPFVPTHDEKKKLKNLKSYTTVVVRQRCRRALLRIPGQELKYYNNRRRSISDG